MMSSEFNNITVLHKMVKNILVRWDKDFDTKLLSYKSTFKWEDINTEESADPISQIVIFDENNKFF